MKEIENKDKEVKRLPRENGWALFKRAKGPFCTMEGLKSAVGFLFATPCEARGFSKQNNKGAHHFVDFALHIYSLSPEAALSKVYVTREKGPEGPAFPQAGQN